MNTSRAIALSLLLLLVLPAYGQKTAQKGAHKPAETTVCKVLDNPSAFDNELVKIRGYLKFWEEGSELRDDNCPNIAVWFGGFGNVILPGPAFMIPGRGEKASGQRAMPTIRVLKDANFEAFVRYMNHNAKAEGCADGPPPAIDHLSDCTTYRVTATFTGRIDGVSKQVHEAHLKLKRKFGEPADGKGFGNMGEYDAQLVVQSVESIVAVDELEARHIISNEQ